MTIEHCVPGAVGGNRVTLSCQECNNNSGVVDNQLSLHQKSADAAQGHRTMRSMLSFPGTLNVATDFSIDDGGTRTLHIVDKASNPRHIKALRQFAEKGELPSSEFHVTIYDLPNPSFFRLALIRSAYLCAFQQFRYAFAGSASGAFLRQLISRRPIDSRAIELLTGFKVRIKDWPEAARSFIITPIAFSGESVIEDRKETFSLMGLFVLIKTAMETSSFHAVVLPGPGIPPEFFLKALEALCDEKPATQTVKMKVGAVG